MKLLEKTKISVKIICVLTMLGMITMFVAWNGSRRLLSADADYSLLIDPKLKTVARVIGARRAMSDMMYASYRVLAYDGDSAQARDAVGAEKSAYKEAIALLEEAKQADPIVATKMQEYIGKAAVVHELTTRANIFGLRNQDVPSKALLAQADNTLRPVIENIAAFGVAQTMEADKRSDELTDLANSTSTMMLTISVLGVLGGIGVAYLVTRAGITSPLLRLQARMSEIAAGKFGGEVVFVARGDEIGSMAKAVAVFRENGIAKQAADTAKAQADAEQKQVVDTVSTHLSELSAGDLTTTIHSEFPADYAALKTNFNDALDKLRELIGAVSESAATIRTGSGEIAQASEDLARRTESNAASLEETAASVTQMDGRLKASAEAATRTVERADQAIATVGGGRAVADEAVQAMGRVSDSAKGIDSVIEGLDKIAFQTRVLAMNAAVEAGRAGDAGRGFAVVADLVSALAMRAEEEAKRARDQLTVTQTDIVTAVEAVTKVDGALANISGDVGQVHELLATMAADNQAQSAAITQISAAIGTMDQATQQNAAMVEETSAAARNLAAEVGGLSEQASKFNTGVSAGYTPPAKPKAARQPATASRKYNSPVKPLPAAAVAARTHADEEWNAF